MLSRAIRGGADAPPEGRPRRLPNNCSRRTGAESSRPADPRVWSVRRTMLATAVKITCALLLCAGIVALTGCASNGSADAFSKAQVSGEKPGPAVEPVASVDPSPSGTRGAEPRGPRRVSPESVRQRMESDDPPLLVCGYDNDRKCSDIAIDGAIAYSEFVNRLDRIPKGREIIFYCA